MSSSQASGCTHMLSNTCVLLYCYLFIFIAILEYLFVVSLAMIIFVIFGG
jgi:hypothetical protein